MNTTTRLRTVGAIAIALAAVGSASVGALAQETIGAEVTIGGGTSGVDGGDVVVLAPGVTISGGEVVNETGIGVVSGGGSSIGAAPGGGDNASLIE
ncbi:MAG: hypothetical protein ACRDJC_01315 [Thermomicrobiales bacterium]